MHEVPVKLPMLTYITHWLPMRATEGAHVRPSPAHHGSVGAASAGVDQFARSLDVDTCTLRDPEFVENAYQRSPPHTTLGSGKSTSSRGGRSGSGGGAGGGGGSAGPVGIVVFGPSATASVVGGAATREASMPSAGASVPRTSASRSPFATL
jgi:hypothetical protein